LNSAVNARPLRKIEYIAGRVDESRYQNILLRFQYQLSNGSSGAMSSAAGFTPLRHQR